MGSLRRALPARRAVHFFLALTAGWLVGRQAGMQARTRQPAAACGLCVCVCICVVPDMWKRIWNLGCL